MGERLRPRKTKVWTGFSVHFSGDVLKWLGFACLCLGTFSSAVVQRGLMNLDDMSVEGLYDAIMPGGQMRSLATLASVTMLIGLMAIPIQAKLFYEGWNHTADQKKYLIRLAGIALISEFAYDWATSGTFWDITVQNPIWALVIAAVMLVIFRQYEGKGFTGILMKAVAVLASLMWVTVLQSYMGAVTVLLVACFALLRNKKNLCSFCGVVISLLQYTAPFGMYFVHNYDGTKGKTPRWVFYVLYPAQLLVFGTIAALV